MKNEICLLFMVLSGVLFLAGCKEEEVMEPINSIVYKLDGRTVKLGDPRPIAVDLSEDGLVDFTIFVELTANSQGDRLYAGMNPLGPNLIKSGPAIDTNFLNMGLLVAEMPGAVIDSHVDSSQLWTPEFGALVIRNTSTTGNVHYEGSWADSEQMVGIQHIINGAVHFGWLRIKFDKMTEIVTLMDYAYDTTANQPIKAGAKSN